MTSRLLHHTRTLATTSTDATPPQRDGDDRLASSLDARFDELSKAHSPIEKRRRLTAEEEQDLILDGPGTRAMPQAPRLGEAYDTAAAACRNNGKFLGMGGVYDEELAAKYIRAGAQMILSGQDLGWMMQAAKARSSFLRSIQR